MSGRAWLRHPAKTIGRPVDCPHGPRFANLDHARAALIAGLAAHSLEAWACNECGGAHITDPTPARSA